MDMELRGCAKFSMVRRAKVRRSRVSGVARRYRRVKGMVYFPRKWLGREVVAVPKIEFLEAMRELHRCRYAVRRIARILEGKVK